MSNTSRRVRYEGIMRFDLIGFWRRDRHVCLVVPHSWPIRFAISGRIFCSVSPPELGKP